MGLGPAGLLGFCPECPRLGGLDDLRIETSRLISYPMFLMLLLNFTKLDIFNLCYNLVLSPAKALSFSHPDSRRWRSFFCNTIILKFLFLHKLVFE